MDDYTAPVDVFTIDGSILIRGPGSMVGAFSPEAAEASAQRILEAVEQSRATPSRNVTELRSA
jgi:hypothetical protein